VQRQPTKDDLARVARELGDLHARCFLTGGSCIPFYLDEPLAEPPRVTYDIDVVVEVGSRAEFQADVEARLRRSGFIHDASEGAPICRWRLGSLIIDIVPIDAEVFGFSNPWYKAGLPSLMDIPVTEHCTWRMLGPPFALASKLEAFWHRGAADPRMSHDLEDIVTLLNGRREIAKESLKASPECREFLADSFARILGDERLADSIESHLFPGENLQTRLTVVLAKMRSLAAKPG
jgi:hypothetical protein